MRTKTRKRRRRRRKRRGRGIKRNVCLCVCVRACVCACVCKTKKNKEEEEGKKKRKHSDHPTFRPDYIKQKNRRSMSYEQNRLRCITPVHFMTIHRAVYGIAFRTGLRSTTIPSVSSQIPDLRAPRTLCTVNRRPCPHLCPRPAEFAASRGRCSSACFRHCIWRVTRVQVCMSTGDTIVRT